MSLRKLTTSDYLQLSEEERAQLEGQFNPSAQPSKQASANSAEDDLPGETPDNIFFPEDLSDFHSLLQDDQQRQKLAEEAEQQKLAEAEAARTSHLPKKVEKATEAVPYDQRAILMDQQRNAFRDTLSHFTKRYFLKHSPELLNILMKHYAEIKTDVTRERATDFNNNIFGKDSLALLNKWMLDHAEFREKIILNSLKNYNDHHSSEECLRVFQYWMKKYPESTAKVLDRKIDQENFALPKFRHYLFRILQENHTDLTLRLNVYIKHLKGEYRNSTSVEDKRIIQNKYDKTLEYINQLGKSPEAIRKEKDKSNEYKKNLGKSPEAIREEKGESNEYKKNLGKSPEAIRKEKSELKFSFTDYYKTLSQAKEHATNNGLLDSLATERHPFAHKLLNAITWIFARPLQALGVIKGPFFNTEGHGLGEDIQRSERKVGLSR